VSAAAQRRFHKHASKREQKDELEYIRMIQSVLASRTFYFSYDYDLTLSAQRRAGHATASAAAQKLPLWQKAEDDFFWNKPVLTKFMDLELHNWIVPVISGFVKVLKKIEVDGQRCDLLFFTRRSWHRVGTRFNVRGVDKDGCVANFAETEMLLVKPDRSICSYVQIRGSIPLYWDQVVTLKYMPRTRYAFSGNESIVDWNELAFRAHMDNIIQRYGHITVVNLIDKSGSSKTVRDQAQLGSAYGKYVKKYNQQSLQAASEYPVATTSASNGYASGSNSPTKGRSASVSNATAPSAPAQGSPSSGAAGGSSKSLKVSSLFAEPIVYVWFDFHHECRKMQWGNLSKLMADVQDQFAQYGWFECDGEGRLRSRQKGVFRVNCMDNLDRTNVVMSLFARRASLMALGLYNEKTVTNVLDSPFASFEIVFKHTWADNADYVSRMYAGTGALKTDFTRTGKRTLAGAIQDGINSVTRYYLNNFADGVRQDAYDLVVGNYAPDRRDESPFSFQHQHTLLNMVLEMCIASALIIGASVSWRPHEDVSTRLRNGVVASVAVFVVLGYLMLKKGSFRSLGRRYVSKPAFSSSGYIRKKEL
jgi:phosphatidylinositol 4-phosphatase